MITLDCIVKKYDGKMVLKGIDMNISRGDSVAFTGHNGCGKSTLLKVIAGLVQPTSGKVKCEKPLLFHYVPEHFPKMRFTAEEYLISQGKIDGLQEKECISLIKNLASDFFFENMLGTKMRDLSKGSLQKVGVIQALLKKPEVLLLDEPLSGQDVESQEVFIEKMKQLQKEGITILMSCHEPYLIDAISNRICRFSEGKLFEVKEATERNEQWFELLFVSGSGCVVPERWKGHLQFIENGCKVRCSEFYTSELILGMLQAGWIMRGMWNEDSK